MCGHFDTRRTAEGTILFDITNGDGTADFTLYHNKVNTYCKNIIKKITSEWLQYSS